MNIKVEFESVQDLIDVVTEKKKLLRVMEIISGKIKTYYYMDRNNIYSPFHENDKMDWNISHLQLEQELTIYLEDGNYVFLEHDSPTMLDITEEEAEDLVEGGCR